MMSSCIVFGMLPPLRVTHLHTFKSLSFSYFVAHGLLDRHCVISSRRILPESKVIDDSFFVLTPSIKSMWHC